MFAGHVYQPVWFQTCWSATVLIKWVKIFPRLFPPFCGPLLFSLCALYPHGYVNIDSEMISSMSETRTNSFIYSVIILRGVGRLTVQGISSGFGIQGWKQAGWVGSRCANKQRYQWLETGYQNRKRCTLRFSLFCTYTVVWYPILEKRPDDRHSNGAFKLKKKYSFIRNSALWNLLVDRIL